MTNSKNNKYNRRKFVKRAHSKDQLRNFTWNTQEATVFPDFNFDAVLKMVDSDPVARGAVNHFVDKCMEGDYNIVARDTLKYDREFELRLDEKYQFRAEILRKIFLMGKLFNNVFVEVVRDTDGRTKALNILDSTNIKPVTAPNGDPIKYISATPNQKTGTYPEWSKDDIVWIKFGDRTAGYAPVDMQALWENLMAKSYVNRYVAWLWKTGQYRVLYNFKGSSDQNVIDFLSYNRKHDSDFKAPFITKGEFETKMIRNMQETESLVELFKYYDGQTLILLRVPPVDAGIPDASGRSSSDAQSNNFATHVVSWKKQVEDKINYDLFPKINKSNNLLKFAAIDRFAEKQVFEIVQVMKGMGFTNDVCTEYLGDRGYFFKSTVFEEIEEQPVMNNPREKDNAPSRIGKGTGEGNQTQEEVTTREDQLRST